MYNLTPAQQKVISIMESGVKVPSIEDIAEKAGVSESTVRRMIKREILVESEWQYSSGTKIYKIA